MTGAGLDHYVLGARLGAGGVGVVYAAQTCDHAQPVVVKFLQRERRDARTLRRFQDEAFVGRLVDHPNVAAVIDAGVTRDGEPYLVMERAPGVSLGVFAHGHSLTIADAILIAREILAGLDAIHGSGIVHADIKSDNVIVDTRDGHHKVKLVDFGLARVQFARSDRTTPTEHEDWLSGTPEYMAPEIVRGDGACFASDLYAVGIILYEMLTGATPFAGGTASEVVHRQVADEVVPPSLRREAGDVPSSLDYVVMRALAKEPTHRYESAAEMSRALALVRTLPSGSRSSPRLGLADRSHRTSPTRVNLARRVAKGTPAHVGSGRTRRPR